MLRHADGRQTYVAMHTDDVPTGTFRSILKQAKLTEEDFRNLSSRVPAKVRDRAGAISG